MAKPGKPSTYTPEIVALICERLASGESLTDICAAPGEGTGIPHIRTVFTWLAKYPEFQVQYAAAREAQMEPMLEEILSIPDTEPDVNRARLKVDARKWAMAHLAPKKYGDKLDLGGKVDLGLGDLLKVIDERSPRLSEGD